ERVRFETQPAQYDGRLKASRRLREDARMLDSSDLALWCALNRLIADYWADVDEYDGQTAHYFYFSNGLYVIGKKRFEGQEQIEVFEGGGCYITVMTHH